MSKVSLPKAFTIFLAVTGPIPRIIPVLKYFSISFDDEGNPIEKVIKLLLNSVYGKTIQNYTDKKISYVKIYDKSFTKFNSPKDREFKLKLLDKWRNKVAEQYKCNEITEDEFNYQMKDLVLNRK